MPTVRDDASELFVQTHVKEVHDPSVLVTKKLSEKNGTKKIVWSL